MTAVTPIFRPRLHSIEVLDQSLDILGGGGEEELLGGASEASQAQPPQVDPRLEFSNQAFGSG